MTLRDVEHFLPLYQTIHRWKNGCKATVNLPLFPGYVFVHIQQDTRVRILSIPSVLGIVGSGRDLLPIDADEIDLLRRSIADGRCQPHALLRTGERVRVSRGALTGLEGILIRKKNQFRVIVELELISQAVSVEIDIDEVEPCMSSVRPTN